MKCMHIYKNALFHPIEHEVEHEVDLTWYGMPISYVKRPHFLEYAKCSIQALPTAWQNEVLTLLSKI